jgi:tetratricopeptide (TPR) repeat protein
MNTTTAAAEVIPTADQLRLVRDLYDRGLHLQALAAADAIGPLAAWRGTAGRILAGRLAGQLGAPRLGALHLLRAFREAPDDTEARYFLLRRLQSTQGPYVAWTRLLHFPLPPATPPEARTRWLILQADLFGQLRDFDEADACLALAERISPESPSVLLERSELLARQDRHAEALALAQEALRREPWSRLAVLSVADLLIYLERDDETEALLREATGHIESAAVWARLAAVQIEAERYAEGADSLDHYARHVPLAEPATAAWIAGRRADCAYGLGRLAESLEWARQARGEFWKAVAARLEQAPLDVPPERRILPVGFIWQHHQTCAPATLATLSRFWSMPGEHLELAEEIAYDGTPSHTQRRWAEGHGWAAREFTVTWDSARALIDRGIPFAVATAGPAGGHLQAVVGYDALRGTLFLRDPSKRLLVETLGEPFLVGYRSLGPRGLVLVPRAKEALLDGVSLPDAGLYDHLHRMYCALEAHDRPGAAAALAAIEAEAPGHRLALQARRRMAGYDGNPAEHLEAVDRLLALFPDDELLLIAKVDCLRDLGRRDERLAVVRRLCDRPSPDSVCLQIYARELTPDGREFATARRLLWRAIRQNAYVADHYLYFANLLWGHRRFDEAFALYRFAACLDEKGEAFARAYFRAARCLGRTAEGVAFLRERFERFGRKSSLPARTLARFLAELERTGEALDVFEEAMRLRPEDGGLLLHAADLCLDRGRYDRAGELITAARGRAHGSFWLRSVARLAGSRGEIDAARRLWEEVLAADPLALDAHRSLANLLAGAQGRAAAVDHLRAACDRFPSHYELARLCNEWVRDDDPPAAEAVNRRLLASHPLSAWAHRELAIHIAKQGRTDEALAALEEAARLEPLSCSLYSVRGFVQERAGRTEEAKADYCRALLLDVDSDTCLRGWLRLCHDLDERRAALELVEAELTRQVTFGDAVFAFQQAANRTLEPEEALATLRRLFAARPDLWHAWSALTDQLVHVNRLDEALPHSREAVGRFPLVATLWVDLARVCYLTRDGDSEMAALRRALEINPSAGRPQRLLAECYERVGRFGEAHAVLERAVQLAPLSAPNHFALADILWKMNQRDEALARVEHSLVLDPLADRSWDRMCDWSRDLGRPQAAIDLARRLAERRPTEARLWAALGRALALMPDRLPDALAALDRALALDPRLIDAHDRKAELLCRARRFDEARAACSPPAWDGRRPPALRLRAAVVEAEARDYARAKTLVREFLRDDPNSYRAWSYLADWSEATRTWDEYREAAENMVRLAPHSGTVYGYRGAGRMNTGDRAGAKSDWQHALYLLPDYAWAAFKLFDAHLADGEFREAARVLRQVRRYRRNEFAQARLCQLHARRRKRGPALRALRRVCLSGHAMPWPLEAAEEACAKAGWRPAVDALYAEALPLQGCRPQVAVQLGRNVDPGPRWEAVKPHLPRLLELIDREIAARPEVFRPHDTRAQVLAYAGRFAEAEAACAHPAQADSVSLHGRLAWVHNQAGDTAKAVEVMSAAVARNADYTWGWRQLAEWTEKLKDWPRHREATENMVRLEPDSAVSFGFRGAARLQAGERDGAREDFRKAVSIDPAYGFGHSQLFELCLADEELDEAERSVEALRRVRDDEYVWRRAALLAFARGNEDETAGHLRRLCLSGHASPWPLQSVHDALNDDGGADLLEKTYAAALPHDECRPQVAMLWVDLTDLNRLADHLGLVERVHVLLDRAIAARPQETRPYDLKALLLGYQKHFDAAEAVCRSPAVAGLVSMRGRLAWVLRRRGRYTAAVALIRLCVADSANYGWGFANLMDWAGELDAWPLRREAADGYIRVYPKRSGGYRQRGHARRELGDAAGARDDYRRALELEPRNVAAALFLFDALLTSGELDEAGRVLNEVRDRANVLYRLGAETRLAARRGEKAAAVDKLLELCGNVGTERWLLDDVVKVFESCGWQQNAEDTLRQALDGEKTFINVGEHWARLRTARGLWLTAEEVDAWAERGQKGSAALEGHALALGSAGRAAELLALRDRHGTVFGRATGPWGRLGEALFRAGEAAAAAEWLGDWEGRKYVTPAALLPLALSLRTLDRGEEATAAHRRAQMFAPDTTAARHELWLALDAALSGDEEEAHDCLSMLAGGKLDREPPYAWLRALVEAVLSAGTDPTATFDDLRQRLTQLPTADEGPGMRQVLEAALQQAVAWACV